ncbi:MAG: LamG domain-containing protein [Acidobacteria bacterium]|nr:LamG domain-containing protein [Acidobacteriota bacterium]
MISLLILALFLSVELLRDRGGSPPTPQGEAASVEPSATAGNTLDPVFKGDVRQVGSRRLIWWAFKDGMPSGAVKEREGILALTTGSLPIRFSGLRGDSIFLNEGGSGETLAGSDAGFPVKNEPRTAGGWIKTTLATQPAFFNYGAEAPHQSFRLLVSLAGKFMFANVGDDFEGKAVVNDGQWHLLVATYDGKQVALYVNGELDATRECNVNTTLNGSCEVGSVRGEQSFFTGMINSVFVANYVLPPAEIQAMARNRPAD